MKTTAKTIGYNDGLRGTRRQAGRSANGFLSKPCNRFTMPPQKRSNRTAGTRTVARQASMDVHGFWNAYIDQGGGVRVRHPLPIRWNAPIDEAEAAFRQLLKRLESRGEL